MVIWCIALATAILYMDEKNQLRVIERIIWNGSIMCGDEGSNKSTLIVNNTLIFISLVL